MLGREQHRERHIFFFDLRLAQYVLVGLTMLVDSGLVREQTDFLSAYQRDTVANEHRDARFYSGLSQLVRRVQSAVGDRAAHARGKDYYKGNAVVSRHSGDSRKLCELETVT